MGEFFVAVFFCESERILTRISKRWETRFGGILRAQVKSDS